MKKHKVLTILTLTIAVMLGCQQANMKEDPRLSEMNMKGMGIGIAYGIKFPLLPLPLSSRTHQYGGITYDSATLLEEMKSIGLSEQDSKAIISKIESSLNDPNPVTASDNLLSAVNDVRSFFETKDEQEIAKSVRIGFVLGNAHEFASVALTMNLNEQQIQQVVLFMNKTWGPFPNDVDETRLPDMLKNKLKKLNPNPRTIDELRDFRDSTYDCWDTYRKIKGEIYPQDVKETSVLHGEFEAPKTPVSGEKGSLQQQFDSLLVGVSDNEVIERLFGKADELRKGIEWTDSITMSKRAIYNAAYPAIGLSFKLLSNPWRIYSITITTKVISVHGLRVGNTLGDVQDKFGKEVRWITTSADYWYWGDYLKEGVRFRFNEKDPKKLGKSPVITEIEVYDRNIGFVTGGLIVPMK